MSAQIFEMKDYQSRKAAEKELMSYLLWSMKHDCDPHRIYADPVEAFRASVELDKQSTSAETVQVNAENADHLVA